MDKIKIVDFKFQGKEWAHLLDESSHVFDNLPRVKINHISTNEKYYLLLHIRQPFDVKDLIAGIPNDLFLLMQQGIVKPVINMMSEQWDLFNTYAWVENRLGLTPDFGETPYSKFIKNFTQRSVPEENITWIVPNNSHIEQINFLRNKGYKIRCNFLIFDYFAYVLRGQALEQKIQPKEFKFKYGALVAGVSRNHRYALIYNLWQNNLLKDGAISCNKFETLIEGRKENWVDENIDTDTYLRNFDDWDKNKQEFINALPITYDKPIKQLGEEKQQYIWGYLNESEVFKKFFLWIPSETKKEHDGIYITEKTWKPIAYGNPFLIHGDNGSIQYLKDLGFQTFDKWWNEDYDNKNEYDKIKDITKIVKTICNEDINKMYKEMLPTLQHNRNQLIKFDQYSTIIKELENGLESK
jgi:hypothetical protein